VDSDFVIFLVHFSEKQTPDKNSSYISDKLQEDKLLKENLLKDNLTVRGIST